MYVCIYVYICIYMYIYILHTYIYNIYKYTIENKNIHGACKHLRMPGTNLKTIKFNKI